MQCVENNKLNKNNKINKSENKLVRTFRGVPRNPATSRDAYNTPPVYMCPGICDDQFQNWGIQWVSHQPF